MILVTLMLFYTFSDRLDNDRGNTIQLPNNQWVLIII